MQELSVKVNAKINLSLNVVGLKNGLHVLDTVMTSVGLADVVSVKKSGKLRVTFSDGLSGEKTNAYRAAALMQNEYSLSGAEIFVERAIPSGAGLGGSSADAAAVIFAMNMLYGADIPVAKLRALAAKVGSDVSYMLEGGCARLVGTGAEISSIDTRLQGKILLCGRGNVDTAKCFRLFDKSGSDGIAARTDALIATLKGGSLVKAGEFCGNALYSSATELNADVKKITEIMRSAGLNACMTGSGSYVFGIGSEAQTANAEHELERHGYSPKTVQTVEKGIEQIV